MNYTEQMLAHVAKRENNNKRKYLVVDPLQGKHVPVSGQKALDMFDALAEKVRTAYQNTSSSAMLLVGFAETATAIGSRLAVTLGTLYMQTTREILQNADYLFFTESHSHATEQKLCKNDIDGIIPKIERIVFVEDEVTTGNTIMKIIDIIEKMYPNAVKFAVASLLNGMDDDSLEKYRSRNIDVHYLVKTHHENYTEIAERYSENGEYIEENTAAADVKLIPVSDGYINARRLCEGGRYGSACENLAEKIANEVPLDGIKTAAVIGTEEFMYPALFTAAYLEKIGISAVTHSTTRSPIAVSTDDGYPLSRRNTLSSLYDGERRTFIYDIKKYDCVIVITDSKNISEKGKNTLVNALRIAGNDNIYMIGWCGE